MTVCAPNSGKWPAIVEALHHYDTDGQIFKAAETINEDKQQFSKSFQQAAGQVFIEKFAPQMILDHDLPAKLELLPIQKEAFYLLHFVYYVLAK